ncbi:MAG TPA: three-Cys-motif partner protein TcmP [Aggregatilineales bacterium]|nr:three-Cys-motif partner protein TcmP [Aggregatilineales bacterium]
MSEDNKSKYLEPVDDGLPMRDSQDYARDKKLAVLQYYLTQTIVSMRDKWSVNFLDLQAGPGKNRIKDSNEIILGSPLIALTLKYPFFHYYFNELNPENFSALSQRVATSPLVSQVSLYQRDLNDVVYEICNGIDDFDKNAYKLGVKRSLNVAFLDPTGLELHWTTVKRLAQVSKMDLIINFSTSGLNRVSGKYDNADSITKFFGHDDLQEIFNIGDTVKRRRAFIDQYLSQLQKLGYFIDVRDLESPDISVRNSKNVEVYSLIFASKHQLGDIFWRNSKKKITPPRLPGFE